MIWTMQLGFAPSKIIEPSLENLWEKSTLPSKIVMTDNHYPLNRHQNRKDIIRIAAEYDALLIDSGGDLGAAQSFNHATDLLPLMDDDYILGYDPDSWALTTGFDNAMREALDRYLDLGYVCLTNPDVTFKNPELIWDKREAVPSTVPAVSVLINRPEMCNITMFRWKWLKQIGGLRQVCNYYGFMENHLWTSLSETGMKMGYLPDYLEDIRLTALHDPEYIAWKAAQVSFTFPGSFAEYLEKK